MTLQKKEPLVSIIIPVYNAENYLEKCINSIIKQTYKKIEILIVNDGSTDKSWELCTRIEEKDNRIKAYSKRNGGVSTARNYGLNKCSGKWVMFVDPDDYLSKRMVASLVEKIKPSDDIIASSCVSFHDNKDAKKICFFSESREFASKTSKEELFKQLLVPEYGQNKKIATTAIGVPWGKIYRKEFIDKYNLRFDPKLKRMQDNLFNMYAFYYARKIVYLNEPLYFYRYEHMDAYFKYRPNTSNIFLPVIKAQFVALNYLGIYNADTREYFLNEVVRLMIIIMKAQIFNKYNHNSLDTKKKEIRKLIDKVAYTGVMEFDNIFLMNTIKKKLIFFFIISRQYCILSFLCEHF